MKPLIGSKGLLTVRDGAAFGIVGRARLLHGRAMQPEPEVTCTPDHDRIGLIAPYRRGN